MLLALIGVAGCGARDTGPAMIPVTGEVSFNGHPVSGADVSFLPSKGASDAAPAQAVTDEAGRFEVVSVFDRGRTTRAGMTSGHYTVTVTQLEQSPATANLSRPPKNLLPAKYAAAVSSGLVAEVTPDGKNHFAFELSK